MKTVERLREFLVNVSSVQSGLFIFLIAFLVRIVFIVIFHPYEELTRYELERTAISLATTGVYGNPYAIPTGPSAHVSPGYTVLLAGVFRVFGTGIRAEIVTEVLASAVTSIICALLPAVARAFKIDVRAGLLAGLVSALYPARPLVEVEGRWETPYSALALIVISVLTVRLWRRHDLTRRNALLHGLAWGISLLFVGALLPMLIVFVIAGIYFCRSAGVRRYVSFATLEVLVIAVCLAPWVIRNWYALGSPIITRSNLGIELRISNNDFASPDQRINLINGLYEKYHPLQNATEAAKVREMGEVACNKQAEDQAKRWIGTHPGRFIELCLGRMRCFWLYQDPTSRMKTIFLNVTVLVGLAGLVNVFRLDRVSGVVILLIVVIYPVPNYLIHVGLRQEYPLHWLMTLLSAALVVGLLASKHMNLTYMPSSGLAAREIH